MFFNKKIAKDISNHAGGFVGDMMSQNSHMTVDVMCDGMELFRQKAVQVQNVDFSYAKGNLFEYIEAAKFNRNAVGMGNNARAIVTDAVGDPHAAADILIEKNGGIVREVQAKVSETFNDGRQTSAASSVFEHAGGQRNHWGKYAGMQRLIRKDNYYKDDVSLLDEAKKLAKSRGNSDSIHAHDYKDVYENLTDELNDGTTYSGGTTMDELRYAYDNPTKYAQSMEMRQLASDVGTTAANMAGASAVTSGIVSGVENMFMVLSDKRALSDALVDVGVSSVKGGVRGGATGVLSSLIRYGGKKTQIPVVTDSTAATVMAGAILDSGVAIYSYARGEITSDELRNELVDTTVKSVSTIYFTKAISAVVGGTGAFVPMAIYTAASFVVTSTREIISNAKLNAAEYERLAILLNNATDMLKEYHNRINAYMSNYEQKTQTVLQGFLMTFDYNLETGENYDRAIYAIVNFANNIGIELQHVDFDDFSNAMKSDMDFVLK